MDEATFLGGRGVEAYDGGLWHVAPWTEKQLRLRSFLCTSLDAA